MEQVEVLCDLKCEELHVFVTKIPTRGNSMIRVVSVKLLSCKYKPNSVTFGCYVTLKVKVI